MIEARLRRGLSLRALAIGPFSIKKKNIIGQPVKTRAGAHGDGAPSALNVAVSDGVHAAASRFTSNPAAAPDSLYTLHDHIYATTSQEFHERRPEDEGDAVVVSSERLTGDPKWRAVPPNHIVAFARGEAPRLFPLTPEGRLAAGA